MRTPVLKDEVCSVKMEQFDEMKAKKDAYKRNEAKLKKQCSQTEKIASSKRI